MDIKCWMTQNFLCSYIKIPGLCCCWPLPGSERERKGGREQADFHKEVANATTANLNLCAHKLLLNVFSHCGGAIFVIKFKRVAKAKREQTVIEEQP